jgi:hypothetical protein
LEGPSLSKRPFSKQEEKRLLKAAREVFLNDYPNPERKGCPPSETLRALAFEKLPGDEANRWWSHLSRCSPCTREFAQFRQQAVRANRLRAAGLIAAAAVLIIIVGWAVVKKFAANPAGVGVIAWAEGLRSAHTDLRGYEALRGSETVSPLPPPVIPRGKLVWTIDLPVGSEPGHYDIELQQPDGQTVARANGTAHLVNGLTVLKIRIDTRRAHAGAASLRVHPPGRSWSRYSVILE